ncbi:hypothetical protein AF41_04190 [Citrobacter sp. MGH 55]|nr:hypothetical protein AF41_04190 [Citrobacter sp. MGH 55]
MKFFLVLSAKLLGSKACCHRGMGSLQGIDQARNICWRNFQLLPGAKVWICNGRTFIGNDRNLIVLQIVSNSYFCSMLDSNNLFHAYSLLSISISEG